MWTLRDASTFSLQRVIFISLKLPLQMTEELKGQSGVSVRWRHICSLLQPVSITAPLMWYSISGFDAVPLDRVDWGHSFNDQSTLEHTYTHPCHMPNSYPRGQQHLIMCFTFWHVKLRNVHEKSSVAVRQEDVRDHTHTPRSVLQSWAEHFAVRFKQSHYFAPMVITWYLFSVWHTFIKPSARSSRKCLRLQK